MSNLPFVSRLSRPMVMALSGAVALLVIAGLLFAAIPRGSDEVDAESKSTTVIEASELEGVGGPADTALDGGTPDGAAAGEATPDLGTPAGVGVGASAPDGATPAAATLAASTPSALIGGGWGSGPDGDAGGMRAYPGSGPQGSTVDVAWKLDIPEGYEVGRPVVYGNRLLVTATSEAFGGNLTVYELESGRFIWSYTESEGFTDPFVATGRVFVTVADSLVALSLETGEVLWTERIVDNVRQQNDGEDDASLSSPVADGNAVIVTLGASVISLDAETGSELWRHEFGSASVFGTRLVGDIVFVTSTTSTDDESEQSTDRYHGLSLETGAEIWRQDAITPLERAASADAGVVLVNDFRGGELEPRMFDARTGQPVTLEAGCDSFLPKAVGDAVVCDGTDVLTGEPVPGADTWPEDAIVAASTGKVAYLASGTQIMSVDLDTGEAVWSFDLAGIELEGEATVAGPGAISVGDGGLAVEVRLDKGDADEPARAIWIIAASAEPVATPVAGGTPAASPAASPVAVASPEGTE